LIFTVVCVVDGEHPCRIDQVEDRGDDVDHLERFVPAAFGGAGIGGQGDG